MNKNIEKIDRYLKGAALPEHVSELHRRQLRRQILNRIERRQTMFVGKRAWKVAALVAVVIGVGTIATAVGLKVRKYYFVGRETDGPYNTYNFKSELETVELEDGSTEVRGRMVGIASTDPNFTIDVEQKIKDLEEIDLLRQQNDRELVTVDEQEVNGKPQPRTFIFKYVLADGSEEMMGEGDPDTQDRERSLTKEQLYELLSLRLKRLKHADKEEYISIEEEVKGRIFVFKQQRYVLSDGTEIIVSTGMPKTAKDDSQEAAGAKVRKWRFRDKHPERGYRLLSEDGQAAASIPKSWADSPEHAVRIQEELDLLQKQGNRELVEVREIEANGQLDFRILRYEYNLSDGQTVKIPDFDPDDPSQWTVIGKRQEELSQLLRERRRQEEKGQELATTEERQVYGRAFTFKKRRFVLSDGTEVIVSTGKPK